MNGFNDYAEHNTRKTDAHWNQNDSVWPVDGWPAVQTLQEREAEVTFSWRDIITGAPSPECLRLSKKNDKLDFTGPLINLLVRTLYQRTKDNIST